ncbi:MAG: EamA family transporter [bacterium]
MEYVKYTFIALIGWGFWAIGSKMMTRYFNTSSTSFWISISGIIFLSIYLIFRRDLMVSKQILYAVPVGIVSMIAILGFYKALKIGPASVVVPLTNMYVIFPVLYGFVFLKETISTTRVLGIIFAVLATIFLSL